MLPADTKVAYRWAILVTAFLGVFGAIGFGRFGYSAVLPAMQEALNLSGAASGSLASWNLGGYMAMALAGGLLAARFGPRIIVATGIVITAVGMLATGFAQGLASASAARLLTGIGNGMVLAPSFALMAYWFEPRRLGLTCAIVSAGAALGLVVVGLIVPAILRDAGADDWRAVWYYFAAIAGFSGILSGVVLRNRPTRDVTSPQHGDRGIYSGFRVVVRSVTSWHLGLVYLLYGFGFITFVTFFQRRLTGDLGLSDEVAGYLFLASGASSLVFGLTYGMISDRFGRGKAMAFTLSLQSVAALLFAIRPGVAVLALASILFGSGGFSLPGLIGAACGERFGAKMAPAAIGFVTIFIGIGQALGPYMAGLLADASGSYSTPYILSAGMLIASASVALSIDLPRRRHHHAAP